MEEKLWVSAAAISDKGCHRDNNEDNFDLNGVVMPLEKMDAGAKLKCRVPLEQDQLYAVCDGMGGEEAGEVASYTAALTMSLLKEFSPESEVQTEIDALSITANIAVYRKAEEKRVSSGSTMVCAALHEGKMTVANIGDSRAYLLRDGELVQLSHDHSEAQQLVDRGFVTREEARTLAESHTVTRYFGVDPDEYTVEATFADEFEPKEGDFQLLCSDGLTDMLTDGEIQKTIEPQAGATENAKRLVQKAKEAGGRDNVTVVLLKIERHQTFCGWLRGLLGKPQKKGEENDVSI